MKFIGWLSGVVAALALILFAVSNGATVALRIEPLPYELDLPLYAVAFVALVLGFVGGGFTAWIGGSKWRRRARRAEAEVARLKRTGPRPLLLDTPPSVTAAPPPTIPAPPRVD